MRSVARIPVNCLAVASLCLAAPVAGQELTTGKQLFDQCAVCHSIDGTNGVGPTLKGVIGRKAGTVPGFRYSRAMKSSEVTWDDKSLDAYLSDPQGFIPGNVMPFSGVADASERMAIIAYLKTLK